MHDNNCFEVRMWKGLVVIPIGLIIVCSYAIINSIITSGRPNSDSGIIATWCFLGVLVFVLIWLTLYILKTVLIVQDTQIITKHLFRAELTFNLDEINEIVRGSSRGNDYYKIIVNNKCVFSATTISYKNYDRLLKYLKNHHKSIIDRNQQLNLH